MGGREEAHQSARGTADRAAAFRQQARRMAERVGLPVIN